MLYTYHTVDVFTQQRFSGNQLAVVPNAIGLNDLQMQRIAAEFNYSETTFVLPPIDPANHARVRIFTPRRELPFAGHPNIGTAFVLLQPGAETACSFTEARPDLLRFEEAAGLVILTSEKNGQGGLRCELKAPQPFRQHLEISAKLAAEVLSVEESQIIVKHHPPCAVGVGINFLCVELSGVDALRVASPNIDIYREIAESAQLAGIYCYCCLPQPSQDHLRARMFAPLLGVEEDPATGSAAAALVGLLASIVPEGKTSWQIQQGIEMGRPSLLLGRAEIVEDKLGAVYVAGDCVPVMRGELSI